MPIDTHTLEAEGFTIHIAVVPDSDATPFDADCYSDADIQAWRNDEWFYVGYVYTATAEGVTLGESSIWGSEWDFPGNDSSIAAWIAEDYYHPDLLAECIADARATLANLAPLATGGHYDDAYNFDTAITDIQSPLQH